MNNMEKYIFDDINWLTQEEYEKYKDLFEKDFYFKSVLNSNLKNSVFKLKEKLIKIYNFDIETICYYIKLFLDNEKWKDYE